MSIMAIQRKEGTPKYQASGPISTSRVLSTEIALDKDGKPIIHPPKLKVSHAKAERDEHKTCYIYLGAATRRSGVRKLGEEAPRHTALASWRGP